MNKMNIETKPLFVNVNTLKSFNNGYEQPTGDDVRALIEFCELTNQQAGDIMGVAARSAQRYKEGKNQIQYAHYRLLVLHAADKGGLIEKRVKQLQADVKTDDDEYPYYDGDQDPRLYEPESQDDLDSFEHVECSNGCGYWAGQLITNGQCPECGSECNNVADDFFDDE